MCVVLLGRYEDEVRPELQVRLCVRAAPLCAGRALTLHHIAMHHRHTSNRHSTCGPATLAAHPTPPCSDDPRLTKRGLFAHPPRPASLNTTGLELMRDLLAIEV